jgi:hypothetical protein
VREPEVHHAHALVVVDHHVVGLEVAVDQPGRVGRRDPAGDVGEQHAQELGPAARPLLAPTAERLAAVHELHGDPHLIAVRADVVDGDHVGVRELGQRLGLAQQPEAPMGSRRRSGSSKLERDLAVELRIVGGVHDAHAAGAEPVEQDVAPDHRAARQRAGAGARSHQAARARTVNPCRPRRAYASTYARAATPRG